MLTKSQQECIRKNLTIYIILKCIQIIKIISGIIVVAIVVLVAVLLFKSVSNKVTSSKFIYMGNDANLNELNGKAILTSYDDYNKVFGVGGKISEDDFKNNNYVLSVWNLSADWKENLCNRDVISFHSVDQTGNTTSYEVKIKNEDNKYYLKLHATAYDIEYGDYTYYQDFKSRDLSIEEIEEQLSDFNPSEKINS